MTPVFRVKQYMWVFQMNQSISKLELIKYNIYNFNCFGPISQVISIDSHME